MSGQNTMGFGNPSRVWPRGCCAPCCGGYFSAYNMNRFGGYSYGRSPWAGMGRYARGFYSSGYYGDW